MVHVITMNLDSRTSKHLDTMYAALMVRLDKLQEIELSQDSRVLITKEPVVGRGASIALHYYDPKGYLPYKLWVKEGGTILGIEAYPTQDLIAHIHSAFCVMQMFGEGR